MAHLRGVYHTGFMQNTPGVQAYRTHLRAIDSSAPDAAAVAAGATDATAAAAARVPCADGNAAAHRSSHPREGIAEDATVRASAPPDDLPVESVRAAVQALVVYRGRLGDDRAAAARKSAHAQLLVSNQQSSQRQKLASLDESIRRVRCIDLSARTSTCRCSALCFASELAAHNVACSTSCSHVSLR